MARWLSTKKDEEYIFIIRNLATITIHDDEIEVLTKEGTRKFNLFLSEPNKFVNANRDTWLYLFGSNNYSLSNQYLDMHSTAMKAFTTFMYNAKTEIFDKKFLHDEMIDCINFQVGIESMKTIKICSNRFDTLSDSFKLHANYLYGQHNVLYVYDSADFFEADKLVQRHSILVLKDYRDTVERLLNLIQKYIQSHENKH